MWPAITEPARLEQWYAVGCPWEIPEPRVGATVKFYNTPEDVLTAVIETLDAPCLWALRWLPAESAPESALVTRFRLEPENGGTRGHGREAGYETLPEAGRREWKAQAGAGYEQSLKDLAALLERQLAPQ